MNQPESLLVDAIFAELRFCQARGALSPTLSLTAINSRAELCPGEQKRQVTAHAHELTCGEVRGAQSLPPATTPS